MIQANSLPHFFGKLQPSLAAYNHKLINYLELHPYCSASTRLCLSDFSFTIVVGGYRPCSRNHDALSIIILLSFLWVSIDR
jgi:hypothetical protein